MNIDTDWQFKAEHWEREAKRLIAENIRLKTEIMRDESYIDYLQSAMWDVIKEDRTGPMIYELPENGPAQCMGNSEGKFAAIARKALNRKGGD
jgi:hypothetical protein